MAIGTFPFGESVHLVEQEDTTGAKDVFVLGVYSSAVHAKWLDVHGKTVVRALAVASEPSIFWRGEDVEDILAGIEIPAELGSLVPAASNLNGPSGNALDTHFLAPLGLDRDRAWLCDLVPHSCVNPGQARAIEREYRPLMQQYNLPEPTVPEVPKSLADDERRDAILAELLASEAPVLITLGDEPLKWFVSPLCDRECGKKLSTFGDDPETYGRLHDIDIDGNGFKLLPLVHPRQAARLGAHSASWASLHEHWLDEAAANLL